MSCSGVSPCIPVSGRSPRLQIAVDRGLVIAAPTVGGAACDGEASIKAAERTPAAHGAERISRSLSSHSRSRALRERSAWGTNPQASLGGSEQRCEGSVGGFVGAGCRGLLAAKFLHEVVGARGDQFAVTDRVDVRVGLH